MVTRRSPRSSSLFFALLAACRTAGPVGAPAPIRAREPADAIAAAKALKDPARAAEVAWLEGNDRSLARARITAGLKQHPLDPRLHLTMAILAASELDEATELRSVLATITSAPESPEAEAALILLHDWLPDHTAKRADILAALDASGLLGPVPPSAEPARAARVALAARIASRLRPASARDVRLADAARGGFLTRWRSIGPLAPHLDESLATPLEQETRGIDRPGAPRLRGVAPPIRQLPRAHLEINPTAGELAGLYVMETFVELPPEVAGLPLVLQVHLDGSGRVLVDGTRVVQREAGARGARAHESVTLELAPGWHRIAVALLAGSSSRPSFSLLGADGAVVVKSERDAPPAVGLVSTPPVIARESAALAHPSSARALVERLSADPERALFGLLLGAQLALTRTRDDHDRARMLVAEAVELAPRSAFAASTSARLMIRGRLPSSLVQARFREALAADPTNASILLRIARSIASEQPDQALQMADLAEESAPAAAQPHELRFQVHAQRGWNAEAARSLEKALELRPSESLLSEGASFYRGLLHVERARALEDRAIELAGEPTSTRAALAALGAGELDLAITRLREAARSAYSPAPLLARIATLELGRGRWQAAEAAAKEALEADPLLVAALRTLAVAAKARGDLEGAKAAVSRVRALGGTELRVETFAAELAGGIPGLPEPESWLAAQLQLDPRELVRGADALDPRFARHRSVRLLDRVIDRVTPDGRALSVRHSIVRLQTKEATDHAGEVKVPEDALPLALRTIKADGRVIDVDRHAGKEDLSFSGLGPGDAVEKQWVSVDTPATAWGGYLRRFVFQGATPAARAELAVVVPRDLPLWWKAYHGAPEPSIHHDERTTTYLFRATHLQAVDPEPGSVSQEEFLPFVVVAAGIDGALALRANVAMFEDIDEGSWDIEQKAHALVEGAQDELEKTRRIFTFLSREIADGEARQPAVVLATKRGDRTGLFLALLRAAGVQAELALARGGAEPRVEPLYPLPKRWGRALVRVALETPKQVLWARMDRQTAWLGKAPPELRGGDYLLVSERPPRPIPFTDGEVERWALSSAISLEVDALGNAKGKLRIELPGALGAELRNFLKEARKADIDRSLQGWVAIVLPGALLVGWEATHVEAELEPLILEAKVSVPSFMVVDKNHLVAEQFFEAPIATSALGLPSLGAYLRLPERRTPLWVSEGRERMTVEVTLPVGSSAPIEQPKSFDVESRFGRFTQALTHDVPARRVTLVVEHTLPAQRISPADFPAFRSDAQRVLQASRNRLIVPLAKVEHAAR